MASKVQETLKRLRSSGQLKQMGAKKAEQKKEKKPRAAPDKPRVPKAPKAAAAAAVAPARAGAAAAALATAQMAGGGRALPAAMQQAQADKVAAELEARAAHARQTAPISKLLKDVIQCLREASGKPLTAKAIHEATQIDVLANEALLSQLSNNPKVLYEQLDDHLFSYRARHSIQDKEELLKFVRLHRNGVHTAEVEDAYSSVLADVEALRAAGQLYVLQDNEQQEVLRPVDTAFDGWKIDRDVLAAWTEVNVPGDPAELEGELRKAGIKPAPRKAPRRRIEEKERKRKRKQQAPRVVTNVHMPELFLHLQPEQID